MRFLGVSLGVGLVSFLGLGCAGTKIGALPSPGSTPASRAPVPASKVVETTLDDEPLELEGEAGPLARPRNPRRVGDVFVHRFARRGEPDVFLIERVEALEGDELEERLTLRGGARQESILVRRAVGSERILSVHRADRGRTRLGLDAYRSFLEPTEFSALENGGLLRKEERTCLVGEREDRCVETDYRVFVEGGEATMRVAASLALERDVLEEVVDAEGVLYRAELVEVSRSAAPELASASAQGTLSRTVRERVLAGGVLFEDAQGD